MLKYYKSGDIVGVSLKDKKGTCKYSENNVDKDSMVRYTHTNSRNNKTDLFDSMDI